MDTTATVIPMIRTTATTPTRVAIGTTESPATQKENAPCKDLDVKV